MKSRTDVFSAIVLLILCAIGAYSTSTLPRAGSLGAFGTDGIGPATFPNLILIGLFISSVCLLIRGFLYTSVVKWPEPYVFWNILVFLGVFCLYLVVLFAAGDFINRMERPIIASGGAFAVSTFLFLLVSLPMLGRRNKLEILLTACITPAVLIYIFGIFFQVLLP